jgi:ribosome hibernation promoting factor
VNMTVEARHMEITDAMRQYVESKLDKLPRFYDSIQTIEAILDREADEAVVEIVVSASRKHTFVAKHRGDEFYGCVDQCVDKVTEQIRRHKDRLRGRRGAPPHGQPAAESQGS